MSKAEPRLNHGLTFADLHNTETLQRLDALYLERLRAADPARHDTLLAARAGQTPSPEAWSELLIACAPLLEEFVAELFGVQAEVARSRRATLSHDPVFVFRKQFVQRRARRRLAKKEDIEGFAELDRWLATRLGGTGTGDRELAIARFAMQLLEDEKARAEEIEKLTRWCLRALNTPEGQAAVRDWVSFRMPNPRDHANLVPVRVVANDPARRLEGPATHFRRRDGFALTDRRASAREVQAEIHYCIYCHDHDGDFCSKGFPEKKGEPDKGLKLDPLGVLLTGCPLGEKISEMHLLKKAGHPIAALAMITLDNPMCAATGHRICNDCMKSCIYQKQDPVNIPQAETRILTDVLELPWGVEIYDLLIRWNPLRPRQWLPRPYNGLKALVIGMGPAGFTLAHHLLMEGFAVVGAEGLKIEPLAAEIVQRPIRDWTLLEERLDERVMAGFGGVAEYGITVRWDKNFLKLIYLSLLRRAHFQIFGGVRFGGTVTVEEAWEMGFDHVAIAVGAGLPQALPIPGSLARGMRQANDFLMGLQLTGAAKRSSLANLQVRLPAVVIGGGLTGIDTATEVQAYYLVQVEKTLERYEQLAAAIGEKKIRASLDEESAATLEEFLAHGRAVRAERARAGANGAAPDFIPLLRQWGGVTVAYRRAMMDSPAYVRNHEEIVKAFEEGIYYAEGLDPKEARLDRHGHIEAMVFARQAPDAGGKWAASGEEVVLPVRSVLVATGARPNVAYEFEHKGHFAKEKGHYQTHVVRGGTTHPVPVSMHCKSEEFGAFTSYHNNGRFVSFVGDTNPVFNGSVVRAVASGSRVYPKIVETFGVRAQAAGDPHEYTDFRQRVEALLATRVDSVRRLKEDVVELTVHAPQAAKRFKPGQFFRLQNFESSAPIVAGTRLHTEPLALLGTRVDLDKGTVSMLVFERGASSRLVAMLKPGEPVLLMGPTGVRARIGEGGDTILVIGGRQAAATVLANGPAWREAGSRVLFFALFDSAVDVFLQDEIEAAADSVIWCTARGEPAKARRAADRAASGVLRDLLIRYARGGLGAGAPIPLTEVNRLQAVGDTALTRLLKELRKGELAAHFPKLIENTCAVHGMMQCMLKGVCSQCLQWQIDPATGKRTKAVFACSWQDEPMDIVDLDNIDERQGQNRLQEYLTNLWLDHLLASHDVGRV
jgi:NADPH-dependent glutamate synthase beta subunit-like oxidoreductase/NAD(P)H-flavin reductase